jgi:hypothetical protein
VKHWTAKPLKICNLSDVMHICVGHLGVWQWCTTVATQKNDAQLLNNLCRLFPCSSYLAYCTETLEQCVLLLKCQNHLFR